MNNLISDIYLAQVEAAEHVVILSLAKRGLVSIEDQKLILTPVEFIELNGYCSNCGHDICEC